MRHVVMLSLGHLTLTGSYLPEQEAFRSTVSHSKHLELLQIETTNLADLESILRMTQTISWLWIRTEGGYKLPSPILAGLATGELLPQLSTLACMVQDAEGLNAHLDMIENRSQESAVRRITKFVLTGWGSVNRTIEGPSFSRLNRLREEGLKFSFARPVIV